MSIYVNPISEYFTVTDGDNYSFKPAGVYKVEEDGTNNNPFKRMIAGPARYPGKDGKVEYIPYMIKYNDKSVVKTICVYPCFIEPMRPDTSGKDLGAWITFLRMGLPVSLMSTLGEMMNKAKVTIDHQARWTHKDGYMWGTTSIKMDKNHSEGLTMLRSTRKGLQVINARETGMKMMSDMHSLKGQGIVIVSATRSGESKDRMKSKYTLQLKLLNFIVEGASNTHGNSTAQTVMASIVFNQTSDTEDDSEDQDDSDDEGSGSDDTNDESDDGSQDDDDSDDEGDNSGKQESMNKAKQAAKDKGKASGSGTKEDKPTSKGKHKAKEEGTSEDVHVDEEVDEEEYVEEQEEMDGEERKKGDKEEYRQMEQGESDSPNKGKGGSGSKPTSNSKGHASFRNIS
jgi:hypothetical protein